MEGLFPVFVEKEPVSGPLLEGVLEQMFHCLLSTSPRFISADKVGEWWQM